MRRVEFPRLDGELLADPQDCAQAAINFGQFLQGTPQAVLRPRSKEAVIDMVRFCDREGIPVTVRGQGHTCFYPAANGGVLIDMSSLRTLHEIGPGFAHVDAGCTWEQVLDATLAASPPQVPPVINGFSRLSIGGTLSAGGISGMAYFCGCQVEHVLELEVVTGDGRLVRCSEHSERRLFEAVLAGQGQCGIILNARVALKPAKSRTREYTFMYPSLAALLEAMNALLDEAEHARSPRLDLIWGSAARTPAGWGFALLANAHYEPGHEPDRTGLFRAITPPAPPLEFDGTFREYIRQLDEKILAIPTGGGRYPMWLDMFVPSERLVEYAGGILDRTQDDDVGQGGLVLLFPLETRTSTRPLMRLPASKRVYLFDYCRNTDPISAAKAEELLTRNNALYQEGVAAGATAYLIGAVRMTPADYQVHYGPVWQRFAADKREFDPRLTLGRGTPIFSHMLRDETARGEPR
ncbi:FAD-binding protein [Stigmatella aurantiaca]|nr:FAD-binding protein [Stigmatella aurantiaca]